MLSVSEAARVLRVQPMSIRRYLASGKMIGKKIGGLWRIEKSALLMFLDGEPDTSSDADAQQLSA